MSTSACLVTATPQFEAPKETAPQLVVSTADPDTRFVVVVDDFELGVFPKTFSADVVSEDGLAKDGTMNRPVHFRLYIDYGSDDYTDPFLTFIDREPPLDPGHIDDTTKRRASESWYPRAPPQVGNGCHTVTMMASHEFDDHTACPKDPTDFSMITWQVLRCDSTLKPPNPDNPQEEVVAPCDVSDFTECQTWKRTCFSDAPDAGGAAP